MRRLVALRALVRATIFAAAMSGVASIATIAHAEDVRLHVVLVDGTELQGELVEKVPDDHLTLKLATGEVRTIPWTSIQSIDDATIAAPTPSPSPPPPAVVTTVPFGTPFLSGLDAASKDHVSWPRPDRSSSPFEGDHLYLGLASGIGTPTGYAGVVATWDPYAWFELEGGVGIGGKFGTGLGAMARFELPLLQTWRIGLGLGYSENLLSAADRAPNGDYPNAPRTARWLNLEFIEMDFATGKTGFFRLSGGYAFLLNHGDYSGMCASSTGFDPRCEVHGFPASPASYAGESHLPFVPYFGIEYEWRVL